MLTITSICQKCAGTGVYWRSSREGQSPIDPCPICGGSGMGNMYYINIEEITNELDWIKRKIKKILNKLDIPED